MSSVDERPDSVTALAGATGDDNRKEGKFMDTATTKAKRFADRLTGACKLALTVFAFATALVATTAQGSQTVPLSTITRGTTQSVTFENNYKPDPVEVKIPTGLVSKTLTGDPYELQANMFTFYMYKAENFEIQDDGTISGDLVATGTNLADNQDGRSEIYTEYPITPTATEVRTVEATEAKFSTDHVEVSNPVKADLPTYYVYNSGSYVRCTDTEVDPGKVYYTQVYIPSNPQEADLYERSGTEGNYTYAKTTDTTVDITKTYYNVTFNPSDKTPAEAGLYENRGTEQSPDYWPTEDDLIIQGK